MTDVQPEPEEQEEQDDSGTSAEGAAYNSTIKIEENE